MLIDGRAIAREITESLAHQTAQLATPPRLSVFVLSSDAATQQFIGIKKKTAERVGVAVRIIELSPETSEDTLKSRIREEISASDGIIVQLPLPQHINVDAVFAAVPASHDVDALGVDAQASARVLPPVVAACAHILAAHGISVRGANVSVVGKGRLVGSPAAAWALDQGAQVSVFAQGDDLAPLAQADIVILGAGAPHLIKPNMIKDGVVILDAGTSEAGGKVVGDADPACEAKATLFTPVPGGIGPIAVAMIFVNLLKLVGVGVEGGE